MHERKGKGTIVILGDSHSINLAMAIGPLINERVIIKNNICDPLTKQSLLGIDIEQHYANHTNSQVNKNNECTVYHDELMSWLTIRKPDMVIFSERWQPKALPYLSKTLSEIKEHVTDNILVLGPNLEFVNHPKVSFSELENRSDLNRSAKNKLINSRAIERELIDITKSLKVNFISKAELICPTSETCNFFNDEMFNYVDNNHWSEAGMNTYGRKLLEHPNFKMFLSGNVDTAKLIYDSWYTLDEKRKTLNMFTSLHELYLYAINVGRFSMSEKQTLVLGDATAIEAVGALYLAFGDKGGAITSYINPCPPLLTPLLNKQALTILNNKALTAKLCEQNRLKLQDKLVGNNYEQIIIAYNWHPVMFEDLNNMIELLLAKSNAKVTVVSLKCRVFIKEDKIQSFVEVNTQLKDVVTKAGGNFIDTEKAMCQFDSLDKSKKAIFELYQKPNSLNLKGVGVLSETYKNLLTTE